MEIITVSKKTVDEAIREACIELGVVSTELGYEVIEKGSAGFLGIGAKQAVIKAWKKEEEVKKEKPKKTKKVEEPKVEEVKEEVAPVECEEISEKEEKLAEVEPQTKEACEIFFVHKDSFVLMKLLSLFFLLYAQYSLQDFPMFLFFFDDNFPYLILL